MPRDGTLPPEQPHPLETALAQEWQSAQLAQGHVGEVLNRVLEAWRQDRSELAARAIRIVGLETALDEATARIVELESAGTTVS